MPSLQELRDLQADLFAEDVSLLDEMTSWSIADATSYFESGGQVMPMLANAHSQAGATPARSQSSVAEQRDRELAMRLQAKEDAVARASPGPPTWLPAPTSYVQHTAAVPKPVQSMLTAEQQEALDMERAIALSLEAERKAERAKKLAEEKAAQKARHLQEEARRAAEMEALRERSAINERARAAKQESERVEQAHSEKRAHGADELAAKRGALETSEGTIEVSAGPDDHERPFLAASTIVCARSLSPDVAGRRRSDEHAPLCADA